MSNRKSYSEDYASSLLPTRSFSPEADRAGATLHRPAHPAQPWSARKDAIQASAEFQLIATSFVEYDWMSST